jgi:hypothetical protein
MSAKRRKAILRMRSVQEFLAVHQPPDSPGYLAQKKTLDEVVEGLGSFSTHQVAGRRQREGETARTRALTTTLRREHLAPITEIARTCLVDPLGKEKLPEMQKVLRLPRFGISPVTLVSEARAMRGTAAQHEARFVESGMPPDFIQQLDAAIEALSQSISGKARSLGRQVGGRAGLEKEIKRARQVVAGLDAIIRRAFGDNPEVLEEWRVARRMKGAPSGNGSAGSEPSLDIAPAQPAAAEAVAGGVA